MHTINKERYSVLVYIDSYFGDRLISGESCTVERLRDMFNEIAGTNKRLKPDDVTKAFCDVYNFEERPFSKDIHWDHVIDLDTYLVYTPNRGRRE